MLDEINISNGFVIKLYIFYFAIIHTIVLYFFTGLLNKSTHFPAKYMCKITHFKKTHKIIFIGVLTTLHFLIAYCWAEVLAHEYLTEQLIVSQKWKEVLQILLQDGLVVSLSSRAVDCGFASRQGHTKGHHKNGTNYLPAWDMCIGGWVWQGNLTVWKAG